MLDAARSCAHRRRLLTRRLGGEPVARITGVKEFWGLPLRVTAATLVPRPETETIVEAALAAIDARRLAAARAAHRRSRHRQRRAAAGAAVRTAERHRHCDRHQPRGARRRRATTRGGSKLDARVHFVACDFGAALAGGFDLVVVNPPYIATARHRRRCPPRCGTIRTLRSMAAADGLACYRAHRRRCAAPDCSQTATSWSNLASVRRPRWPPCFGRPALKSCRRGADLSGIARALSARWPQ